VANASSARGAALLSDIDELQFAKIGRIRASLNYPRGHFTPPSNASWETTAAIRYSLTTV
jgi:hypothetical protein